MIYPDRDYDGEAAFEKALKQVEGVTDVKGYVLVNNTGWTFSKNGFRFDVRFWANCYGVYVGAYELMGSSEFYAAGNKLPKGHSSTNLEEILSAIKAL